MSGQEDISNQLLQKEQELREKLGEEKFQQLASMVGDTQVKSIIIVDLNGKEISLGAIQLELAIELRECLNDNVNTCFFTNYYFEHQGKRINDYDELANLDMDAKDNKIYMRPDLYSERSARTHIKKFKEILYTPGVLNLSNDISDSISAAFSTSNKGDKLEQQEIESNTTKETEGLKPGEETKGENESQATDQPNEPQADDTKQSVDKSAKVDEQDENKSSEAKDEIKSQEERKITEEDRKKFEEARKAQLEEYDKIMKSYEESIQNTRNSLQPLNFDKQVVPLSEVFTPVLEASSLDFQPVKCLEYIAYSNFNPPPSSTQMQGDLMYLKLRTLEGHDYVITCNTRGFYINSSIENVAFDPTPSKKVNPCFSHSLVGCISQISDKFSQRLEEHINLILNTDPFCISQAPHCRKDWVAEEQKYEGNWKEWEESVSGFYGMDAKGTRDWNEEFQVCKDLPKDNLLQRIQRDRAFSKIYSDFIDSSKKAAVAIISESIAPLNPMDEPHQHVFVYNQIFLSYAVDSGETYKDVSSADSNPTYTATNHDMLGLNTLQAIDIDGLHIIATCHVNYKGHRVIAQSIIPGILTNTDQSGLTEFGSVDDGATIFSNEEFCEIVRQVCDKLGVKGCKILDGTGAEHDVPGSIDIKGIRGTDKRKYLLDLVRLTPRDTNYKGNNFTSCLVRPELLRIYQKQKELEYASEKIKENHKDDKPEEEDKKEEEKKYEEMTEEEKENAIKKSQEKQQKAKQKQLDRIKEFDQYLKEAPQYKFNLNVFTNAKLAEGDYKEDEEQVTKLGQFIVDTQIPKIIKIFETGDNVPTDNESLGDLLHSYGINIRYLGKIYEKIESEHLSHVKNLIERSIICRCAKKIVNEMLRKCPQTQISTLVAHILNLVLAPNSLLEKLNNGEIKASTFNITALSGTQGSSSPDAIQKKKKNKKKNKGKTASNEKDGNKVAEETHQFELRSLFNKEFTNLVNDKNTGVLGMKPSELWRKVVSMSKKKFDFKLEAELIKVKCRDSYKNKVALLRDLCLSLGIKIKAKDYNLIETSDVESKQVKDQKASKSKSAPKKQSQNYDDLPFSHEDVLELTPIIKQIEISNFDYKFFISSARSAIKEGYYEQAFEYLNQAININLQIAGPINKEAATCLSLLANIHAKFGDFMHLLSNEQRENFYFSYSQAIQLQTKCVILSEKLFGKIHPQTAQAYMNLYKFHNKLGNYESTFKHQPKQLQKYLQRALYVYEIVCGDNHPEIANIYLSLGLMYLEVNINDAQTAIECFKQALYRNIAMYGEEHIQVANCYQVIASAYQNLEYFRKALEYQEKSHNILVKLFSEDDMVVKNSLATIDQFTKLSVHKELNKKSLKNTQRQLGSNKKPKANNQNSRYMLPGMMTRQQYMNLAQWFNMGGRAAYANGAGQQQPSASTQ